VLGFWPAHANGEDIVLDEALSQRRRHAAPDAPANREGRRQAQRQPGGLRRPEQGDYLGGFVREHRARRGRSGRRLRGRHDDYNSILLKALADRLAESLAERCIAGARELWGYAPDETLDNEALIRERYRGIRPAPAIRPAPITRKRPRCFPCSMRSGTSGVSLSDSFAMDPAASVSGWYFAHPQAKYFGVGKIGRDQVESLAARKGTLVKGERACLLPRVLCSPCSLSG
jgi:5-methyltetrahydrofolate--homocysteine methyltransferase